MEMDKELRALGGAWVGLVVSVVAIILYMTVNILGFGRLPGFHAGCQGFDVCRFCQLEMVLPILGILALVGGGAITGWLTTPTMAPWVEIQARKRAVERELWALEDAQENAKKEEK